MQRGRVFYQKTDIAQKEKMYRRRKTHDLADQVLGKVQRDLFGEDGDIRVYFAPGRVNMIGEHTDYNGGHVFPCALTIGTYAARARKRDDREASLSIP